MISSEDDIYSISTLWTDEYGIRNKGLCYFYHRRMKKRIKNHSKSFSVIVENEKKISNFSEIKEYYCSISEQYSYLLFNLDQIIKIEKGKNPDNDYVFFMTYYTYNFILSAKSILDIFAWLIYYLFACDCKMQDVSLVFKRYDNGKVKHTKFKEELNKKADKLFYEHISSDAVQSVLSNLEQHRDIISHRGKIHILKMEEGEGKSSIIKPESPNMLKYDSWETLINNPNCKLSHEKCSKFSEGIFVMLDDIFFRINECIYKKFR